LLRTGAIIASIAMAVFTSGRGIKTLSEYKTFNDHVIQQIEAAQEQAVLPVQVFQGYSRFIKPMNYQSDNFFAHEIIYRAYFDKKNVQFVSDSVYIRHQEGRLLDGALTSMPHCDHPGLAGPVYTFRNQDYMAILFNSPSLPCTFQTARAYSSSKRQETADQAEAEKRKKYGIHLDYTPVGIYPIEYQGQIYLICHKLDQSFNKIVIPLTLPPDPEEITIENF